MDQLSQSLELLASYAPIWGYVFIFVFMMIESSFIPFPSEIVLIPAGFLACRGELTCHIPWIDFGLVFLFGLLGSLAGACINYFLSLYLGRSVLHKYGKYVFLSEKTLNRSEEIFRKYGELATFVCRLLPGIRQLISIPAGLCHMEMKRFLWFTGIGAGVWSLFLIIIGWSFGLMTQDMTYTEMIYRGKDIIHHNYGILFSSLFVIIAVYFILQHYVMKVRKPGES
ncbi:MAG: DedA family protein [Lentisphaeria bacterium]